MAPRAFTILELLVVVTIIVVLLALLLPSLENAVYQAQLASCGTRLGGVAKGALAYTMDHRRAYPVRDFYMFNKDPKHIAGVDNLAGPSPTAYHDERPTLRGYIDLSTLLDPLTKPIELANTSANADVFQAYLTWYGWRYVDGATGEQQPGMNLVGDRFEWRGEKFSVLASDYDEYQVAASPPCVYSSHPDRDGTLAPQVLEDEGGLSGYAASLYLTRWRRPELKRGPLDLNFAFDDGSVRRLTGVELNINPNDTDRTTAVPQYADATAQSVVENFTRIPPQ